MNRRRPGALRRAAFVLGLLSVFGGVLAVVVGPAAAHPEASRVIREIVRLQGTFGAAPASIPVQREVTLLVLADRYPMKVTDWQIFGTAEAPLGATEPNELRIQGDRVKLAEFAEIKGEQRVTILGERRPGSSELFLLALDLCPPLAPAAP